MAFSYLQGALLSRKDRSWSRSCREVKSTSSQTFLIGKLVRQTTSCLLSVPHSGLTLGDVKLHFKITTFKEEYEFSLETNKNRPVMLRYRQFGKAYVENAG